jgi:hypothetical protein
VNIVRLYSSFRTGRDHLRIRAGAWARRVGAERRLERMADGMQHDLRAVRRDARTAVATGRADLTVAAARRLEQAMARLAGRGDSAGR